MGKEIERKFLVLNSSFKEDATVDFFHQGFLSTDNERVVRVRLEETRATLTIKGKSIGPERPEFEYEIPIFDAEYLLSNICIKPTIKKNRYKLKHKGFMWEIDEFMNENEGLIVAEIELPEKDAPFKKPSWLGEEITYDHKYYNASLVKNPYQNW